MADAGLEMDVSGLAWSLDSLDRTTRATAESQMKTSTLVLESEVKRRSPVDTGNLRASYESRVGTDGDTITGRVGTNVEYAATQEYIHTPHLRPAMDAKREDILQILGADTLEEALSSI